jgi:glyoxylase-like metal-dependent hydrolase (beta-lactamase superfamily II)
MNVEPAVEPFFHAPTGSWSYVVHAAADAVVIDPVLDFTQASGRIGTEAASELLDFVERRGLRVRQVLETHAHADHLTAAAFVQARTGAPVAIGAGIRDVQAHFAPIFGQDPCEPALRDAFDRLLGDGDVVACGHLQVEVMALPGHTADSLGYRIGNHLFVGDTLFAPDIGTARCDFPGGDALQLHASIQRLHALPADTVLWLCHDYPPAGRERRASVPVGESARDNRMLSRDTSVEAFTSSREKRDATLAVPQLLYPALQVNIRGGRQPPADDGGRRYLRTPVQVEGAVDGVCSPARA